MWFLSFCGVTPSVAQMLAKKVLREFSYRNDEEAITFQHWVKILSSKKACICHLIIAYINRNHSSKELLNKCIACYLHLSSGPIAF